MSQRDTALTEEPIFWTHTMPGYNDADRSELRMVRGRQRIEKFPQTGHVGDFKDKRRMNVVRFIFMVNDAGNEVAVVMTNAAAHADSRGPWAQYQLMKARKLGWYHTGDCPCALLTTGRLRQGHVPPRDYFPEGAPDLFTDKPCEPGLHNRDNPCKHSLALQLARQKLHAELEAERLSSFRDNSAKMLEATQAQTAAIVAAIQAAMASSGARSTEEIRDLIKGIVGELNLAPKGKDK